MGVTWTGEARAPRWPPRLGRTSTTSRRASCLGTSTRPLEVLPTGRSLTRRPSALASRSVGSPAYTIGGGADGRGDHRAAALPDRLTARAPRGGDPALAAAPGFLRGRGRGRSPDP